MKFKISKAEFDALPEAIQALYASSGDGYQMQVEGLPESGEDVSGLKKMNEKLLSEAKAAKEAQRAADLERTRLADEAARTAGDVAAIDKSWGAKLETLQSEFDAYRTSSDGALHSVLVEKEAQALATSLGGESAPLLMPFLLKRMKVERTDDGAFKTRVLDDKGQPSALTIAELQKEFASNPTFKPVIVASQAQGLPRGGQQQHQPQQHQFGKNALQDRAQQLAAMDDGE